MHHTINFLPIFLHHAFLHAFTTVVLLLWDRLEEEKKEEEAYLCLEAGLR